MCEHGTYFLCTVTHHAPAKSPLVTGFGSIFIPLVNFPGGVTLYDSWKEINRESALKSQRTVSIPGGGKEGFTEVLTYE